MDDNNIAYTVKDGRAILSHTPSVLRNLLTELDPVWIMQNEGTETWSPFDILGHLIHGERTDWMTRAKIIVEQGMDGTFVPFDRFAQFNESKGKDHEDLLNEFDKIRRMNLTELDRMDLSEEQLNLKSNHPHLGIVSLRQLLATWAAHDLVHINQITRVMAKQYKDATGPWAQYINLYQ